MNQNKRIALAVFLTFVITGAALQKDPKIVKVDRVVHDDPEVEVSCEVIEDGTVIECWDEISGQDAGSFEVEDLMGGQGRNDAPPSAPATTTPSPAEISEVPEGYFTLPCAEDEVPTVVDDSERELPSGVWYICIHIDEYGESGEQQFAWDEDAGYLINR